MLLLLMRDPWPVEIAGNGSKNQRETMNQNDADEKVLAQPVATNENLLFPNAKRCSLTAIAVSALELIKD